MKPRLKHFIPFYGFHKYSREYFSAEKRDAKDAIASMKMIIYHLVWCFVFLIIAFKIVGI